jgi:hypothetical protein
LAWGTDVAKLLYFDCFSGVAGDMTLAALLDLGLPEELMHRAIGSLGLPVTLKIEKVKKAGWAATYVKVEAPHESKHRHLKHIHEIIDRGALTPGAKELAKRMFLALAEAEAAVHRTTVEKVHFHEVGALDSIVDFIGCAVGFDHLEIDEYAARPVATGTGTVQCEHGLMPVPAPATALLLQGVPLAECAVDKELTTPTGAAILKTLVPTKRFGPMPAMTVARIGVGAGTRDLPNQPNVLRLMLGETATAVAAAPQSRKHDEVWMLETNLDDTPAEFVGYAVERLLAAGALDVYVTPIQMKKQRPGALLSVLCHEATRQTLEDILFSETGTLGVRRSRRERVKLPRKAATVLTVFGEISGKIAWHGGQWRFAPEYESCAAVARVSGEPLAAVYQTARDAFAAAEPPPAP